MVLREDGSKKPFEPSDFAVGEDVKIFGRFIRVYDCDEFPREYYQVSMVNVAALP